MHISIRRWSCLSKVRRGCFLAGILALVPLPLLSGCSHGASDDAASHAVAVKVQAVHAQPLSLATTLNGRVAPVDSAEVRPQVSGILEHQVFKEGSLVHKGDLLYQIDPSTYQAAVNEARSALRSAIATRDQNLATYRRYQSLAHKGVISRNDFDNQKYTYLANRAEVDNKRAALQGAQVDLEHTRITAPLTGIIGRSTFTQGALVSNGQSEALATIRKLDPIYVDVSASLEQYYAIRNSDLNKEQRAVSIFMNNDNPYPHKGELKVSESYVDESTGTVRLRAQVANPDTLLLPGMYVRARMYAGELPHGFKIPVEAVQRDTASHAYVMVVEDGKAVRHDINTVETDGHDFIVDKGLKEGDRIVVDGLSKLTDGDAVTVDNGNNADAGNKNRAD